MWLWRKRNTAVALEAQVEIMALLTAVSGVVYFFLNQQSVSIDITQKNTSRSQSLGLTQRHEAHILARSCSITRSNNLLFWSSVVVV